MTTMTTMTTRTVEYPADGLTMIGHLALPYHGPTGGGGAHSLPGVGRGRVGGPIMPPAQRNAFTAEMQAAGVDWRLAVYGGALHAFHHPPVDHPMVPGVGYHPQHAQRARRDVVDLLAECLPVTEDLGA